MPDATIAVRCGAHARMGRSRTLFFCALLQVCAFVGRITLQKGVHLILQAVEELMRVHGGAVEPRARACNCKSSTDGVIARARAQESSKSWLAARPHSPTRTGTVARQ